jgi:hypothetical protein
MQAMCQFIDCLWFMHHLQHQSAPPLRQDGEHLLRILESERDLAFEGLTAIGTAGSILGPVEKACYVIGTNNQLGHDFLPLLDDWAAQRDLVSAHEA